MGLARLSVSRITSQVLVGSTPKNVTDVEYLVENYAIDSILNLQSDADLRDRQIDIGELEAFYSQREMEFCRFEINDFDPVDMAKKLVEPIKYLIEQVEKNRTIFVHCNAGICRAPSTVLGYLFLYEGMTLDEGLTLIRSKRSIANPYIAAVSEALEQI
jgi:protein-tyrosine phosphatase